MTRRVLWLIKGLGPGGAERLLVAAAAAGDRTRVTYDAAYLVPWKDTLVEELRERGVHVECLDAPREWDLRWAVRLRRLLSRGRYDVVHVHSPYVAGITRLVVATLPRATRPRVVSTEHNAWETFAVPTRILNGVTATYDDAIIAVSPHVAASMWPRVRARAEVVRHGVALADVASLAAQRESVRRELGVVPGEVLVGTVANYRVQKDYPTLLAAARDVVDRGLPVRFCAVGQGPEAGHIEECVRALDLDDRVILTGYRPDATRVMAGFDIFALASRFEGLPVALMEALALGLPIVATRVGGVPEAVTDGTEGILVGPGSPGPLADAIATLAADPARRAAMGAAARARSAEFDIRRAVARVESIYREVTDR